MEFETIFRTLHNVAERLPFPAKVVTQQMLDDWEKQEQHIKAENRNNLNWEWCVKNNILNCVNYLGRHDLEYAHLGPDCR
jgi:large subunit ribosomal protein L16